MLFQWLKNIYCVHTEFLYTPILEKGFFYFDFWSLVHIWSGMILYLLLAAYNVKRRWLWLISIIILYEIIEVLFVYFALHIFKPERYNDLLLDIILGIIAALLCDRILSVRNKKKNIVHLPQWSLMLFSSVTYAFVWVGNYGYKYTYAIFNTKGLNIGAFGLWVAGGFIFMLFYYLIKNKEDKLTRRLILSWIVYFSFLLVTEYNGYYLMQWREISLPDSKPLILGLIHGNWVLHCYYLFFPFLIIPFFELLSYCVYKAQINLTSQKVIPVSGN
jgi:hypothetical protein